jgi:beta-glucanase (GH16 family)
MDADGDDISDQSKIVYQIKGKPDDSGGGKPGSGGEEPQPTGPWNLVFEDNFNTNLSAWNIWEGGAFNEEIQLYTESQLNLSNGILNITIQRENVSGPTNIYDSTVKDFEYLSGRIESKAVYGPSATEGERQYRFEARIKLPYGNGMWPAFWTFGDPWPTQGEIDILEARGGEPMEYQSNIFYGPRANRSVTRNTEVHYTTGVNLTADFHVYAMVWSSNFIEIYFDGELMHTYIADRNNQVANLFGKKEKIALNTAVGGLFFQDRNSANYADAALMQVDWVRVYNR